VRTWSPVEAAVALAIGGSLLATTVPEFVRNLHASRLVEPIEGLERIGARATARAAGLPTESAYPESVGLTPERVAKGERLLDPPGTWDHPTWRTLGFSFSSPHSFSFAFESRNAAPVATFRAFAHGDLDGDGNLSTFELSGRSAEGAQPELFHLEIHREVE
jgi:hypothetical protein